MSRKLTSTDGGRWAFLRRFDIPDLNDPTQVYLSRLRVAQSPYGGVYLHRIYLPDDDRAPHDHPWPFTSIVLRGGYTEVFYPVPHVSLDVTVERTWRAGSVHRMAVDQAHRITRVEPGTVTLVVVGRRCREWGFFDPLGGWLPWPEWIAERNRGGAQ